MPDPKPNSRDYNQTGAEQLCNKGKSDVPAMFNADQCGVLQKADSSTTNDRDLKPVPKGLKQDASVLANNTVGVVSGGCVHDP